MSSDLFTSFNNILSLAVTTQNLSAKILTMAATTQDQSSIDKVKKSEVPVPWCQEFNKM